MSEDKKKDQEAAPNPMSLNLWMDNPPEVRAELLDQAKAKIARGDVDRVKKEMRWERLKRAQDPKNRARPVASSSMLEDFHLGEGIQLDDGWLRLAITDKWGNLEIFNGTRYADDVLGRYCKEFNATKSSTSWPRGTLPKSNPWKDPFTTRAALVKVEWQVEEGQYRIIYNEGPGVTSTFWFPSRFRNSTRGTDWLKVRHVSPTVPWVQRPAKP